jgi:N-acetylglutamate synthase-like GNAT family acetyltransferase
MPDTSTGAIDIRAMREDDLEPAMELLETWNMAPETDTADAERSTIRVENTFVAEDSGTIVGVASYIVHSETLAETASLAVDPDYRGRGVGYRLQVKRLEAMRSLGIETVRTETDRPQTIEWYVEHFGYERVGTTPKKHEFSLSDVDEWTILELDLEEWDDDGD